MQDVLKFKSVVKVLDWITVFVIALALLIGVIFSLKTSPISMAYVIASCFVAWVFKVLGFGMAYCAIAVAENTENKDIVVKSVSTKLCHNKELVSEYIERFVMVEQDANEFCKQVFKDATDNNASSANIRIAMKQLP